MSDGQTPPEDPMERMRRAYASGVEAWSAAMEQLAGSDRFAADAGELLAMYARQQDAIRAAADLAAESVQMPTADDIARVAQLVVNVERKVDDLVRAGEALDARLDAIEAALRRLQAASDAQADAG